MRLLALLLTGLLLSACSSDEGATGESCTVGRVLACACPGSTGSGTQACLESGAPGPCTGCPGQAGGAAGSSGNSGQGGAAPGGAGGTGPGGQGGAGAGGSEEGGASGVGGSAGASGVAGDAGAGGSSGVAGASGVAGSSGSSGQAGAGGGECGGGCDAAAGEVCVGGACLDGCAAAAAQRTSVGCEFWAVDLDNEPEGGFGEPPAGAPWGLLLANPSLAAAQVTLEINEAAPGQPAKLTVLKTLTLAPGAMATESMASREVDGSLVPGASEAPGTFVSAAAVRVTATQPITVHQHNTLANSFSNDASLLLPTATLGTSYRVLGWPPANPFAVFPAPGIPDHAYLTVVGTAAGTTVKVRPAAATLAGGGVPASPAGGEITVKLGPFEVLNLETAPSASVNSPAPDLSGSQVDADQPVAVFFGTERALVPSGQTVPLPPGGSGDNCCAGHLEEQLVPVGSLGRRHVVVRSPVRSVGSSFREADVVRLVGGAVAAQVTTSLPGALGSFALGPGERRDLVVQDSVVVEASEPIVVGQLLVGQSHVGGGLLGDPALRLVPAVDQFLASYAVPVPGGWDKQYLALAVPQGAAVTLDGAPPSGCAVSVAGVVAGVNYEAWHCSVAPGLHRVESSAPVGVAAYGYGQASAYAVNAGARFALP